MTLTFVENKQYRVKYVAEDWTPSEIEGLFMEAEISLDFPTKEDYSSLPRSKVVLFFHTCPGVPMTSVILKNIVEAERLT